MSSPSSPPRLSPPLPIAKRLNRNALTVVAVLLFMTVLVVVVTTRSSGPTGGDPSATPVSSTESQPQPSFLDVPLAVPETTLTDLEVPEMAWDMIGGEPDVNGLEWNPQAAGYPAPYGVPEFPQPTPDPVEEAYRRALRSPVISNEIGMAATTESQSAFGVDAFPSDTTDQAILRALIGTTETPMAPTPSTAPPPSQHETFLARMAEPAGMTAQRPSTPYHLEAGTVIPAALITAVNSDLPGPLLAQVTRPVYDSRTQRIVVIPQGTKLIGQYDQQIASGQQRLLIAWTRMTFPNGRSVTLPGVGTSDIQGAAGLPGHVNNHTRRVFGNALLLSVISAGMQLSQPQQSTVYAPPSAGQVAAGAVGQQLGEVATEMIRKQLQISPTITLKAGTPFNVLLKGDFTLSGPATGTPR